MTDRISLDHLTSDQLDQLYDQLDELREVSATRKRIARRRREQLDQAEDLLSVAHETSNRSEAERAAAVQRAERAEAAIARVRKLAAELFVEGATHTHRNIGRQLLNALQPPEDGDGPTELQIIAALHRSAEQDVTRVIELYERWVKAGPPPLGTSIARWWDARLVELHDAIRPPDPPAHNAGPTVAE